MAICLILFNIHIYVNQCELEPNDAVQRVVHGVTNCVFSIYLSGHENNAINKWLCIMFVIVLQSDAKTLLKTLLAMQLFSHTVYYLRYIRWVELPSLAVLESKYFFHNVRGPMVQCVSWLTVDVLVSSVLGEVDGSSPLRPNPNILVVWVLPWRHTSMYMICVIAHENKKDDLCSS